MTFVEFLLVFNFAVLLLLSIFIIYARKHIKENLKYQELVMSSTMNDICSIQKADLASLREFLIRQLFKEHLDNSERLQSSFKQQLELFEKEIRNSINNQQQNVDQQIEKMNNTLFQQLREIRNNLDSSLTNNFTKSNQTYHDIVKRLSLIDAAQKRIGELSSNIIGLQEILSDKQCRGVFGEVQLATIVKNILPAGHYKFQYTLSNGKRADCVLLLPEPTGMLVIDSKFPIESYRKLQRPELTNIEKELANKQFKKDIRKHITDISSKYILPSETADCAIMFIPAESVFSEIHTNHSDLVTESFNHRVWLVSPTTMMAILNTSNAVIKDLSRQKEINVIQDHLNILAKDFDRFQKRMDALSKHIRLANEDVDNVHASAKKIVSRFDQIEKVEIEPISSPEQLNSQKVIKSNKKG